MKATLIIRNIEKLYTCAEDDTIYENAFVAMHHDVIMACGSGTGSQYRDEATRILDATGEIVTPAFIEAHYEMPRSNSYNDMILKEYDRLFRMYQAGITTVMTAEGHVQNRSLSQDVFRSRASCIRQLHFGDEKLPEAPYVLTCGGPGANCSLQPAAYYARYLLDADPYELLKASTVWPAKAQKLTDRGMVEPGKLADLLVLRASEISRFYELADTFLIRRIIKNGIPVWPEIIRC